MNNNYFIPQNFAQEGYVLGIFKIRNLIETVVLCILIGYPLMRFLPLGLTGHITVFIFTEIPLVVFGIRGVDGLSLTQFLFAVIKFMMNKRVLKAPTSKDRIERQKRLMEKRKKKLKEQQKAERYREKDDRDDRKEKRKEEKRRKRELREEQIYAKKQKK